MAKRRKQATRKSARSRKKTGGTGKPKSARLARNKKSAGKKRVKKPASRRYVPKYKKRRGRQTYYIDLPNKPRTIDETIELADAANLPRNVRKGLPDNFAKITVWSKKGKKSAAVSYVYQLDKPGEVGDAIFEILTRLKRPPKATGRKKYMQKIRALLNYMKRITVEFQVKEDRRYKKRKSKRK